MEPGLKTYFAGLTAEQREVFASSCGTSRGHLQNVMYGVRPCAPELATLIEQASHGAVRRWHLRPEDWHRIWPELIGITGAPPVSSAANDDAQKVA